MELKIGDKIRALIDYPYGGTVKKGEIGKVISINSQDVRIDFPSQKDYCIYTYQLKDVGKIENIKEPVQFEVGKWYRWFQENHGSTHIGRIDKFLGETFYSRPWIMQEKYYNKEGCFDLKYAKSIELLEDYIKPTSNVELIKKKEGKYLNTEVGRVSTVSTQLIKQKQNQLF